MLKEKLTAVGFTDLQAKVIENQCKTSNFTFYGTGEVCGISNVRFKIQTFFAMLTNNDIAALNNAGLSIVIYYNELTKTLFIDFKAFN